MPLLPAFLLLFVALKLLGVIAWSWLWVMSPIWIGIPAILLVYVVFFGGFALLASALNR